MTENMIFVFAAIFCVQTMHASDATIDVMLRDGTVFPASVKALRTSKVLDSWIDDLADVQKKGVDNYVINMVSPELFRTTLYPLMALSVENVSTEKVDKQHIDANSKKRIRRRFAVDPKARINLLNIDQMKELAVAADYYDIPKLLPLFLNRCGELLTSNSYVNLFAQDPNRFVSLIDIDRHLSDMIARSEFMQNKMNGFSQNPLYNLQSGKQTISFSPDGKHFVSSEYDNQANYVIISNAYTGKREHEINAGMSILEKNFLGIVLSSGVLGLKFSPDGRRLVAVSKTSVKENFNVKIFDVHAGNAVIGDFVAKADEYLGIDNIIISPDGNKIALCRYDKLYVYNLLSGEEILSLGDPNVSLSSVAFTPNSAKIAVWENERSRYFEKLKIFDFNNGGAVESQSLRLQLLPGSKINFNSAGNRIAVLREDRCIVFDSKTGQLEWELYYKSKNGTRFRAEDYLFSSDGSKVIVRSEEYGLMFLNPYINKNTSWSYIDGSEKLKKQDVTEWSSDGNILAYQQGNLTRVWDGKKKKMLQKIALPKDRYGHVVGGYVTGLVLSPLSNLLATKQDRLYIRWARDLTNLAMSLETELTFLALNNKEALPRDLSALRDFAVTTLERENKETKETLRDYFTAKLDEFEPKGVR